MLYLWNINKIYYYFFIFKVNEVTILINFIYIKSNIYFILKKKFILKANNNITKKIQTFKNQFKQIFKNKKKHQYFFKKLYSLFI